MLQFIWIITDTLKETKLKYCFNQWWPSIKNSSLFSLFINHSQTTCIKIIGGFFINEGWSISRRTLVRMATLRGGHLKEGILQYYTENYFRTLIMQGGGCWIEVHSFTVPLKTRWPLNWWLLIKSSFGVAAMSDWNYTKELVISILTFLHKGQNCSVIQQNWLQEASMDATPFTSKWWTHFPFHKNWHFKFTINCVWRLKLLNP